MMYKALNDMCPALLSFWHHNLFSLLLTVLKLCCRPCCLWGVFNHFLALRPLHCLFSLPRILPNSNTANSCPSFKSSLKLRFWRLPSLESLSKNSIYYSGDFIFLSYFLTFISLEFSYHISSNTVYLLNCSCLSLDLCTKRVYFVFFIYSSPSIA